MRTALTDRDLRQREIVPPEKLAACQAVIIGVVVPVTDALKLSIQPFSIHAPSLNLIPLVRVVVLGPDGVQIEVAL